MAAAAALLLVLLFPGVSRAWLPEGHMATGAIAFDALERHDPQALATVLHLVQSHPDRARFTRDLGTLAGRDRDRRTFELLAVWADVVRGGPFDHDDWHYSQAFASSFRHLVPFAFGGAEDAFRSNLAIARNPAAPAADRALALGWVIHIVGDMHQPLHAAVWISFRFPFSDAGGNWSWVRRPGSDRPERLHFFWDSAGRPGGLSRASPDAYVAELQHLRPFEAEPPVTDPGRAFDGWVAQTRALARTAVYGPDTFRPGVSPADAPVLSPDYVARAQALGADQIAAAGNRIGQLLLGLR